MGGRRKWLGRRLAAVVGAVAVGAAGVVAASSGAGAVTLDPAGRWGPLEAWPLVAIHVALTGDGKVVSYGTKTTGGGSTGRFSYDVWTPGPSVASGHNTLPNTTRTDIFCNVQVVDPTDRKLVLFGGDNFDGTSNTNTSNPDVVVYDPATQKLTQGTNMQRARWYGSAVTLHSGAIYVQGGLDGKDRAELWRNGATTLLPIDTTVVNWNYPRLFVQADGSIFGIDNEARMFRIDAGLTKITVYGMLPMTGEISAAQFQPGRILVMGGTTKASYIIEAASGTPTVTRNGNLSTARQYVNATLLPDGRVLATGGSDTGKIDGLVNRSAEIWDPRTGTWSRYGDGAVARLYHSTALLLPDGRVLVAGDNSSANNLNAELYSPSYLVASDGSTPPRPSISAVSASTVRTGSQLSLTVSSAAPIQRVTLLKAGTNTHTRNFEQRFVEVPFNAANGKVDLTVPDDGTLTPGGYLLYVLDTNGVPSVARIVHVESSTPRVGPPPPAPTTTTTAAAPTTTAPAPTTTAAPAPTTTAAPAPTPAPAPAVTAVGPAGSNLIFQPVAFRDQAPNGAVVTGVNVWSDTSVNGIQLVTSAGALPVRGRPSGSLSRMTLAPGEQITSIFGRSSWWIQRIGFRTTTGRTIGPFGSRTWTSRSFDLTGPPGSVVVGLFGTSSGSRLGQIGLLAAPR